MNKLSEYKKVLSSIIINDTLINKDLDILGISNDSRKIKKDFIFVAIKGDALDGHKYIEQAVEQGASVIVYEERGETEKNKIEKKIKQNPIYVKVSNGYQAYALLSECYYGFPSKNFKLLGVTGTNGKTTIAYILREILKYEKSKVGLISTIEYDNGKTAIDADRTTPEAYELQGYFSQIKENKCDYAVMEASSHGLVQHRVGSKKFTVGIFTNLTGDHLNYHKTYENYYQAKKLLFTEYLDKTGVAIINIDDKYGERLANEIKSKSKCVTYGTNSLSDCRITEVEGSILGTDFIVDFLGQKYKYRTDLIGLYNIHNITATIVTSFVLYGIFGLENLSKIFETLAIPGRLERIETNNDVVIFIDYAHTDDALDNVLKTLKPLVQNKLIVVFGCGGDRDTTKRPKMGKIAVEYADTVILTNDNPRTENPNKIIEDIQQGIPKTYKVIIELDREKAIAKALSIAKKDDTVLIAGKGHEKYQVIGDKQINFSDKDAIIKYYK